MESYEGEYQSPAEVSFVTDQGSICSSGGGGGGGGNETRVEVTFRVNIYLFLVYIYIFLSVTLVFGTEAKTFHCLQR